MDGHTPMGQYTNYNTENYGVIQARLSTLETFEGFQKFLEGKEIKEMTDGKSVFYQEVVVGEPLANKRGLQAILSFVKLEMNSLTVQGNFPDKADYDAYILEFNIKLAKMMMDNLYVWGIKEDNYQLIMDSVVNFAIKFDSRLIGNKERESYANTVKINESSNVRTEETRGGGFKIPFIGK